jgi:hypothetical protein
MPLTLKKIAKLTAGRHFDKDGVYLDLADTGNGSWLLGYQLHFLPPGSTRNLLVAISKCCIDHCSISR